ncbi:MAG: adenosine deaminase [Candidatus Cloacimonetes bacterium]|nr:adenosine deaminase [Candidatus Cloacimonadota bacterium]
MRIKLSRELLKELPKTDLHLHLDGSLRPESIIEMAKEQKVQLPTFDLEELKALIVCGEHTQSLEDYLRGFHIVNLVLQDKEALERAAFEVAEDAAAENTLYLEMRYAPMLHANRGLSYNEIVSAVLAGLERAERDFGIKTGLIICGIRNMAPSSSLQMAELAVEYKDKGVVAFDLAGGELNFPAKAHKAAFELAGQHRLNITAHAGEASGAQSIQQALFDCGAHRIGHGTRLFEDKELMDYVNNHRIPLEICLTSNLHTKAVQSIAEHPINYYLEQSLRVTLNTDNRVISNTTLTDEYLLACQTFDWDYATLKRVIINGFKSAFSPYPQRVELIQQCLLKMAMLEAVHTQET